MAEEIKSTSTGEVPAKSAGPFAPYKSDQGRYARQIAFWTLLFIGFYGSYRLSGTLESFSEGLRKNLIDGNVPVLGVPLTLAFIISTLVFTMSALWLYWFLNRPKSAELLIETEGELKKVTWPTVKEATDASLVVIGTVVVLMAFIAGVDAVLGYIVDFLLFRRV